MSVPDYSDLNIKKLNIPQSVGNPVTINPKEKNYLLVGQGKYEILSLPKYQHLVFSEPVYIEKRKISSVVMVIGRKKQFSTPVNHYLL